jgi:DME family drug/metabolite transporter
MLPVLAVVTAALCFSTTGTSQALADVDASPVAVGAARVLVGGGTLGLIAIGARLGRHRGGLVGTGRPAISYGVPTWGIVAIGAAGVLAYQPTFFLGVRMNGVAVGTVIALGAAPILTGVIQGLICRRFPGRRWAAATVIAVLGVVLVSGVLGADTATLTPSGMLASAAAGASYAVYTIASKALLDRGWSPRDAMGSIFGWAAVCSLPLLLLAGTAWLATPDGLALALWLGIVTTAAAYLLFAWGLQYLQATTVATLTLAEPLGATVLGVVVLHEELSTASVLGLAAIAGGLLLLSVRIGSVRSDVAPAT